MAPTLCFLDCETTGLDAEIHEVWEVACILRKPDGNPEAPLHGEPAEDVARRAGWIDSEYVWQLPVSLRCADPMALDIGHFWERRHKRFKDGGNDGWAVAMPLGFSRSEGEVIDVSAWAHQFAKLTWGAHIIGMVPSFDTDRLGRLMRAHGVNPGWHYQPIDVESVAAGAILQVIHDGDHLDAALERAWPVAEARPADERPTAGQLYDTFREVAQLPWDSTRLSQLHGIEPGGFARHTALGDCQWAAALWDALHE